MNVDMGVGKCRNMLVYGCAYGECFTFLFSRIYTYAALNGFSCVCMWTLKAFRMWPFRNSKKKLIFGCVKWFAIGLRRQTNAYNKMNIIDAFEIFCIVEWNYNCILLFERLRVMVYDVIIREQ